MIHYRHFLNTDLPHLSAVWNQQPALRGQLKELSLYRVEHMILSKPYFDPRGLIFAIEDEVTGHSDPNDVRVASGKPLGFVHAGFAPNGALSDFDVSQGIVSLLQVVDANAEVADELLKHACNYLEAMGATSISAGARFPFSPFYLGLYGGSEIPGVLMGDNCFRQAVQRQGFTSEEDVVVMRCELSGFRPVSGRDQLQVRRKYQINTVVDPKENSWWESCTMGLANRERFSIYHKRNQRVCGNVSFWDMQPLAGGTPNTGRGMYGLNVPQEFRRSGIATFLVGEALKYYMQQGVEFVEAQTFASDSAATGVFEKLGFVKVDQGSLFQKTL